MQDNENTWSELISSYLTAADSLVGEVRKDLDFDQTLIKISETVESTNLGSGSKIDEIRSSVDKSLSQTDNSFYKDELLNSFNISVDEERTGATYIELLQSYQVIFQKWQASEIQSQLKAMKISDLETVTNSLTQEVVELKQKMAGDCGNSSLGEKNDHSDECWQEILKELGEKRNTHEILKEKECELLMCKKGNEILEEEVKKLEREKEEVTYILEENKKEKENVIEELRIVKEKLISEHNAELRKKDMKIQELEVKIEEVQGKLQKESEGKTICGKICGKILSAEKLKIQHNKVIIMKDEKIKGLMEKIIEIAEENKRLKVRLNRLEGKI